METSTYISGKRKIYYTIGGSGRKDKKGEIIVGSSWNPGRSRPSKRFKKK